MPRTAGKKPLSRDRIVKAAIRYADKHGIESLNMRKLATQLDAGAMSLYHYFKSKDKLLDAMVEWVAGEISIPQADVPWRTAITDITESAYTTLTRHTWANAIWSKRTLGPVKLAYMEAILRILRQGGFTVHQACDAYHAITVHIHGFIMQAVDFPVKAKDIQSVGSEFLASVDDPDAIPYFIEHVQHHLDHTGSSTNQFRMMLDLMLDGFERQLAE